MKIPTSGCLYVAGGMVVDEVFLFFLCSEESDEDRAEIEHGQLQEGQENTGKKGTEEQETGETQQEARAENEHQGED